MGSYHIDSPLAWCLALRLLRAQHSYPRYRHYDLLVRRFPREVQQDSAHHWNRADVDRCLLNRLDMVNLVGMAHAQARHRRQGAGPTIPQQN